MLLSLKKLLFSHPPCRILVPYSKFYLFHLLVLWYFLPKTFLTKKDISLSLLFLVQLIVPLFLLHTGHRELVVQCFQFLLIHVLRHQLPIRRILPPHHILVNQVLIGQLLLGKVSFLHITSHHITSLEILTLFTIFWVIIAYLHISPSSLPCLLLLFLKMFKRHLIILVGDKPWLLKCRLLRIVAHEN